jgi:hypothetical protein
VAGPAGRGSKLPAIVKGSSGGLALLATTGALTGNGADAGDGGLASGTVSAGGVVWKGASVAAENPLTILVARGVLSVTREINFSVAVRTDSFSFAKVWKDPKTSGK